MGFSLVMLVVLTVMAVLRLPPWFLFLPAIAAGATYIPIGPMVRARWTKVLKPSQLHAAFSLESSYDELTFVIGPAVVTVLASMWLPTAGVLVPVVLTVVGVAWFVSQRATEPSPVPARCGEAIKARSVLFMPGMAVVVAATATMGGMFGSFDVATVAVAEHWGVKAQAAIVLATFAFGSCVSGLAYGSRTWVGPIWRRFLIGLSAMALGYCVFPFLTSIWQLTLATLVVGVWIAPTIIMANQMIQLIVPPARLVEGLTWVGASLGGGVSIGSTVTGILVDHVQPRAGFLGCVGASVVALLICLPAIPLLKKATTKPSTA
jgi:predicted MFS family arabinose efflux permease